jgi:methylglutaconyl-CoA hydratase
MSDGQVLAETWSPGIVRLTLDRPAKRNALNEAMLDALGHAIEQLQQAGGVRAMILQGNGPAFCSGMDLNEAADPAKGPILAAKIGHILDVITSAPFVSIASVHGAVMAGGAGLATACDFILAADDARIGYPEVLRGLTASMVMTLLRRQLPERWIRELLLLGDPVDVNRAREMGLVNWVVPAPDREAETRKVADRLLRCAPGAVAETKKLLGELWHHTIPQDLARAIHHHLLVREAGEFAEGLAAFAEKRKAGWERVP